jgi:hypothetical protein
VDAVARLCAPGHTEEKLKIKSDAMPAEEFNAFLLAVFASCRTAIEPNAGMYVCHASSVQREFQTAIEAAGFEVRTQIIWAKNTFAWGFAQYKFQHEPIQATRIAARALSLALAKCAPLNGRVAMVHTVRRLRVPSGCACRRRRSFFMLFAFFYE